MKTLKPQNFSLLIDFTCVIAKDELEKHPEMQTIAMIELENNFPSDFSAKVLKCLPPDVAKIIMDSHRKYLKVQLAMQAMIIIIADDVEWSTVMDAFFSDQWGFVVPTSINHLSKFLIINSKRFDLPKKVRKLLNVVQIHEENQKVMATSFDRIKNLTTFDTFKSSHHENLSQILFPDKTKNLNGKKLYVTWVIDYFELFPTKGKPEHKWIHFVEIVAEKMNAELEFIQIPRNFTKKWNSFLQTVYKWMGELIEEDKLDFMLKGFFNRFSLHSYNNFDACFLVPLPANYSIAYQILILPLQTFLAQPLSEKWLESSYDIDGPVYQIVLAIVLQTPEIWMKNRVKFLKRLIVCYHARHLYPTSTCKALNGTSDKDVKDYNVYKGGLMLFALVDLIYKFFFAKVAQQSKEEDWPVSFFNFIRKNDEAMLKSAVNVLENFKDEYLPCTSFGEFCDVAGLLNEIDDPEEFLSELLQSLPGGN